MREVNRGRGSFGRHGYFVGTEQWSRPTDLLELGREIALGLGEEVEGDLASHWMAHHLAGLILAADAGDAAARDKAEGLVIRLWERRGLLAGSAYPLSRLPAALTALENLGPNGALLGLLDAESSLQTACRLLRDVARLAVALFAGHFPDAFAQLEVTGVLLDSLSPVERTLLQRLREFKPALPDGALEVAEETTADERRTASQLAELREMIEAHCDATGDDVGGDDVLPDDVSDGLPEPPVESVFHSGDGARATYSRVRDDLIDNLIERLLQLKRASNGQIGANEE